MYVMKIIFSSIKLFVVFAITLISTIVLVIMILQTQIEEN